MAGSSAMMTLTAYALRRGVTPKAVSKAVAAGRLSASVVRDKHGAPKIADPDLADREWEANTRARVEYAAPVNLRSPRLPDPPHVEEMPGEAGNRRQAGPAAPGAPSEAAPAAPRKPTAPPPRDMAEYYAHRSAREASEARRAAAQAELAELELAARRGQLIDAEQARADVIAAFSLCKTRLLAVPSAIGQRLPDIADRVVPEVDALIRDALEELSSRGGSGSRAG